MGRPCQIHRSACLRMVELLFLVRSKEAAGGVTYNWTCFMKVEVSVIILADQS